MKGPHAILPLADAVLDEFELVGRKTSREEVDELNDKLRRDHERLASDRDRSIAEIRKETS